MSSSFLLNLFLWASSFLGVLNFQDHFPLFGRPHSVFVFILVIFMFLLSAFSDHSFFVKKNLLISQMGDPPLICGKFCQKNDSLEWYSLTNYAVAAIKKMQLLIRPNYFGPKILNFIVYKNIFWTIQAVKDNFYILRLSIYLSPDKS